MADITKCRADNCPKNLKNNCQRYTAKEQHWQSWLRGDVNRRTYECKDFVKVKLPPLRLVKKGVDTARIFGGG